MQLSIKGRLFVFASNAACSSPARLLLPPLRTCYAVADYDAIALRQNFFFSSFLATFLGGPRQFDEDISGGRVQPFGALD